MHVILAVIFAVIFTVTIFGGMVLLNGFVFQTLWAWFIVPIFGLAALTVLQAVGVGLVVSFLTHQSDVQYKDLEEDSTKRLVVLVLRPLMILGVAWIVQLFM